MKFKKPVKVKTKKVATKKPAKKAMVKLIKTTIQKTAEVKVISAEHTVGFGNILQSSVMNVRTLSPSSAYMPIVQGATSDERIGNKIATRRVLLRYILNALPYNATSNLAPCPMDVIMWIGRLKRSVFSPTATDFQNFLQFGSGSVPPLGDLADINSIINKDYFTVDRKIVHKIGFSAYDGSGVNIGAQSYHNNDYKYNVVRTLDVTNCFAKSYLFNDADNDPQNSRTYIWFEAIRADGLTGTSAAVPIIFRGTVDYQYTDV